MKAKYGLIKTCSYCGNQFETKPRFLEFCSTKCKNPLNRGELTPWNKGIKLTKEQKEKLNLDGLKKGWGWNKGQPSEASRLRMLTNNPNKDGRANNMRPKNYVDDEFTAYKRECRKATYRSWYAMKKEGLVPENTGKRPDQYQLDHIIPYKQGYELGIPPSIIGSRKNLRYILGKENRKKWDCFQEDSVVQYIIGN